MTLPKPILKNANRPPPSPMIVLPPQADEPLTVFEEPERTNYCPTDENGDYILPDFSDLPGTEDDFDFVTFPPKNIINRFYEIVASHHHQGFDYFLLHNKYLQPDVKYYARHDKDTKLMMIACPNLPDNSYETRYHEPVYKYFKKIFHQKASPTTFEDINEFYQLKLSTIVAYDDTGSDADLPT